MSFGATASSYITPTGGGGSSAYAAAVLVDNPLVFYEFDDTSGTTMVDSSGNGRDGAYINSPSLGMYPILSGSDGHSTGFDGIANSERAAVSYNSWMNTSSMTIMTTCFVEPQALRIIASRYTDVGNDWSWFLYTTSNKFMLYYRSSGGTNHQIDSGVTVSPGVKYFVTAYVDPSGSGLRVYDDTGLIASATGPGVTLNSSSRNLVLMDCDPPNLYPMTGHLDGFAYFGSALTTTRLDELAGHALAPTAKWINRAAGVSARNGTTDHALSLPAASAGSLLVAIISSPATSTATTPGWTKRVAPQSITECAVFTRSASSGDSSLAISLSASNVPLHYVIYEFPAGSAWHSSTSNVFSNAFPDLTSLPGTPVTVFGALSGRRLSGETPGATTAWQYFWKTDFNQETVHDGVTEGVYTGVGYFSDLRDTTASAYYPTTQFTQHNTPNSEKVVFALTIP